MTNQQLGERDAKRSLGAELLQSVREMKAGQSKLVRQIDVAKVVTVRALQRTEKIRCKPTDFAQT